MLKKLFEGFCFCLPVNPAANSNQCYEPLTQCRARLAFPCCWRHQQCHGLSSSSVRVCFHRSLRMNFSAADASSRNEDISKCRNAAVHSNVHSYNARIAEHGCSAKLQSNRKLPAHFFSTEWIWRYHS